MVNSNNSNNTHTRTHLNGNPVAASLSPSHSRPVPCIQWRGFTPLYLASQKGHRAFAELLIRHKADPNRPDKVTRGEGWEVAPMVVEADACIAGVYDYGYGVVVWIFAFG